MVFISWLSKTHQVDLMQQIGDMSLVTLFIAFLMVVLRHSGSMLSDLMPFICVFVGMLVSNNRVKYHKSYLQVAGSSKYWITAKPSHYKGLPVLTQYSGGDSQDTWCFVDSDTLIILI